jgi:hypothetical protein
MVWWNDEGAAGGTAVYLWLGAPESTFSRTGLEGMKRPRPNQAMERTATRRAFTFPVASAPPLQATAAAGGRR